MLVIHKLYTLQLALGWHHDQSLQLLIGLHIPAIYLIKEIQVRKKL